jgi:transposase
MGDGSWVGVDLHARSAVAAVLDGGSGELRAERVPAAPGPLLEWLGGLPSPVRVAYEAGPCGFELARACERAGLECVVAAPGRIPRGSAERVKTDRRDAERLARLLRLRELTSVRVPSEGEEAVRDLVRAREDARGDLMRSRHRLSKLLHRHGLLWERGAWTGEHDRWLRSLRFEGALAVCFDEAYAAVLQTKARRDRLDHAIAEAALLPAHAETVGRLACLRGISTLTALALAVEIGDWHRFEPASLGAFLGLVPSEHSSGGHRRQGAITKTGNGHARRLLVEAAWHQRRPLRPTVALTSRRAGQPAAVCAEAEAIAQRLHKRWWDLERRGKRRTIVAVAVARELAGHCWKLATM